MPHVDNLTLGKGKLYFEQFSTNTQTAPTGKKYRFIGNVSALTVTQEIQTLDHFSSTGGIRTKDRAVTIQNDMGGQFTTDHIGAKNMAMLFQGSEGADTLGSSSNRTESIAGVELDTYIQLGTSDDRLDGYGRVDDVVVVNGADTLVAGTDYDIDEETGMLYLRDDAEDVEDGDDIVVHYDILASTRNRVVDESREIYGALRFIADNPVGENRDTMWPYVKVSASGDFGLITEEWQTMTFEFEVQKAGDNPRVINASRFVAP